MSRILFFTGAPCPSTVTPATSHISIWEPSFSRFNLTPITPNPPNDTPSAWRSIPLIPHHLPTGLTQPDYPTAFLPPSFLSIPSTSSPPSSPSSSLSPSFTSILGSDANEDPSATPENLSQFYNSSFHLFTTGTGTDTDTDTDTTESPSSPAPSFEPFHPGANRHLSDLEDLPTARHLLHNPHTILANLIVTLLSIRRPHPVTVTKSSLPHHITTLLVADETRTAFSITLWHPPVSPLPSGRRPKSALESLVESLRRQDILLLTNVALGVFKQKVFGQSVRGGDTTVRLLYRKKLDPDDISGHYSENDMRRNGPVHPQLEKVRKVQQWMIQFVGGGPVGLNNRGRGWDEPPDDSQSS